MFIGPHQKGILDVMALENMIRGLIGSGWSHAFHHNKCRYNEKGFF